MLQLLHFRVAPPQLYWDFVVAVVVLDTGVRAPTDMQDVSVPSRRPINSCTSERKIFFVFVSFLSVCFPSSRSFKLAYSSVGGFLNSKHVGL